MISYSQKILIDGEMTGTDENTSDPLWVGTATVFGIQALRDGDAAGSVKLQASCSPARPNTLAGNLPSVAIPDEEWEDIPDSTFSVAATVGWIWSYDGAGFNWVRAVYTNASGTGTINVRANVKSNEVLG